MPESSWRLANDGIVLAELVEISLQRTRWTAGRSQSPSPSYGRATLAVHESYVLAGVSSVEAFWIGFESSATGVQVAVRVRLDAEEPVDAITGAPWTHALRHDPPNYVAVPPEHWLDGLRRAPTGAREPFGVRAAATGLPEQLWIELVATRLDSRGRSGGDEQSPWISVSSGVTVVVVTASDFTRATGRNLPPLDESHRYRGRRYP